MSRKDLEGRVVIVTGAAGGIGRALVRAFLDSGMRVAAADLDGEPLRLLQREMDGDRLAAVPVDISDCESCRSCVERAVVRFGRVDCLVNNAGLGMGLVREDHFSRRVQIKDIRPEVWQRIVAVNLSCGFFMERMADPMLCLFSDAAAEITGRRYVAANWDPALPEAQAEAAPGGAPAGWPDLAQNPVWPGRRPGQ